MIRFLIGALVGAIAIGLGLFIVAPARMIRETPSPYGVEETVQRLQQAATRQGWSLSGVRAINKQIAAHGQADVGPVHLVEMCQPAYAAALLDDDPQKRFAVLMPCTIAVYEKSDRNVYVATLEAGLLGRLFPGEVSEVFGGSVARDQSSILEAALATAEK
jgi:uncharacterized protein (DUF302 family)